LEPRGPPAAVHGLQDCNGAGGRSIPRRPPAAARRPPPSDDNLRR